MARPGDFKILKDNRSTYNLIAHEHHVPRSPLFGPGPQHMQMDSRRDYQMREERMRGPSPRQVQMDTRGDYQEKEERMRGPSPRQVQMDTRRDCQEREDMGGGRGEGREDGNDREWENAKEVETARGQYTEQPRLVFDDYRSPREMIRHEKHVPASPLYRPGQGQGMTQVDPRYGSGQAGRRDYMGPSDGRDEEQLPNVPPISHQNHIPVSPLYRPGGSPKVQTDPRYGRAPGWRQFEEWQYGKAQCCKSDETQARQDHQNMKGKIGSTIGHVNHVPVSPLYRPGMGRGLSMGDPRYGSPLGKRQQFKFEERKDGEDKIEVDYEIEEDGGYKLHDARNHKVPRPRDPPTPDYNTTQLHIQESNADDDTKLQLRGSQEDLRDYQQNNASWAGYQDRPVNRGPPYSDRPGYAGDRSYRENPWTQRYKGQSDVVDPRVGGHHDGIGLVGSRNGGALLFIRFPIGQGENIQVAAQSFLKSKTHDNGGRFIGLAKKVFDFGYEKRPTEAVGVYHFPSIEKAFLFFQMDPIIRQPDFPPPYGHAEIWIVSNAYLPDNLQLFSTFLLSEVELHSGKEKREFFETFQKPFESYLYKNGAMPFVICSYGAYDRKSLRRHAYPPSSIVTCHLFQGLDHLNWITNDETYSKFRSLHNQMATEKCSIFTLSKDMFP